MAKAARVETVFSVLLLPLLSAWAQTPGTFTPTGYMTSPRAGHTATLLLNGKVLIAGGDSPCIGQIACPAAGFQPLASAELYDPLTGAFAAAGSMALPRYGHQATLLADGTVLIVGNQNDSTGVSDGRVERYDPSTGTFSVAGDIGALACPDNWSIATLLPDGRVLIGRGCAPPVSSGAATLYDPVAGTFSPTGAPVWVHNEPVASLLADGTVLIVEGRDFACEITGVGPTQGPTPCGGDEIYNPTTGAFAATGAVSGDPYRGDPPANLLPNGLILVAGGDGGNDIVRSAELYDPSSGTFAPTANMSVSRVGQSATTLPDGTVLVAGGGSTNIGVASSVDLYLPFSGTFAPAGNMTLPRVGFASVLLNDGSLLLTGGEPYPQSAELYRPANLVPAPVLFTIGGNQGAVWSTKTGQLVTPGAPAGAGDVLAMYTTNLIEGGLIPPRVFLGGLTAPVLYFGDAPGYPGYFQVNFQVPDVGTGAIPLVLRYLERSSNSVVIQTHGRD